MYNTLEEKKKELFLLYFKTSIMNIKTQIHLHEQLLNYAFK